MVNYTLTVTNLNDSSSEPVDVTGIQEQNYIFTALSSCDMYSFQVTAINAAGASNPSQVITRSLPSLPDISPVEESLSHSLMVTGEGVQLTVSFQVSDKQKVLSYRYPQLVEYCRHWYFTLMAANCKEIGTYI